VVQAKNSYCLQMYFQNYEVMFDENILACPGAGGIIQKCLKRKIALLSKKGLRICAMRLSIQRQM